MEVLAPGSRVVLRSETVAGARYRLTVTPETLGLALLEWGRQGEAPLVSIASPAAGQAAVYEFQAEVSARWELRVGGFSAATGRARARMETLDAKGQRAPAHRRYLAVGGPGAHVGELLLREANAWVLDLTPGTAYQIDPTEGSAGRVRLRVLRGDGTVVADSEAGSLVWMARPFVRFAVPQEHPGGAPGAYSLEVRGLFDGGGTYGVRLTELEPGQSIEPASVAPVEPAEPGPADADPDAFHAGPGDLAFLYVPQTPVTRIVQVRRGDKWVSLDGIGQSASARSQENALLVWFRPYYPGDYRFVTEWGEPSQGRRSLLDREALGGAPLHLGTGVDPQVRVRLSSRFELVGLAGCMPGWDYLYVLTDGPDIGAGMRVRDANNRTVAERSVGSSGAPVAPGYGPSLRFRVKEAGVYRLEARGVRRFVVAPLIRRASN